MIFIVENIQWIMLISGIATCTMVYAVFFPAKALQTTFGESPSHPVTDLLVRSWGALVALIGVMLIYAAMEPNSRELAAVIAGSSKIVWCILFITFGRAYLSKGAGVVGFDLVVGLTLLSYFFAMSSGNF